MTLKISVAYNGAVAKVYEKMVVMPSGNQLGNLSAMARPTILLAEPEPDQALSVRKLVIESAKFNVITAHNGNEALELFQAFQNVSGVVVHSQLSGVDCESVIRKVKETVPDAVTIFLPAGIAAQCKGADHTVSSYDPEALLDLLRRLFGDPRAEGLKIRKWNELVNLDLTRYPLLVAGV